jgi:quercetin dioxygenase-like cupin family protein
MIYPSLPALFKMAETLSVDVGALLRGADRGEPLNVFPSENAAEIKFANLPKGLIAGKLLTPVNFDSKVEAYLIEIPPGATLPSHFLSHKGEEIGYLLQGALQLKVGRNLQQARSGDVIYLADDSPSQWKNSGGEPARLLWLKIK